MASVGIRELKTQASAIVRRVREEGAVIDITYRGQVVARLTPVRPVEGEEQFRAIWTDIDRLAAEISARWQGNPSATEAVAEQRREL